MPDEPQPVLHIELKNVQPVELSDYAESLNALSDEFRRYGGLRVDALGNDDTRLFVKELRNGSLIADLVVLVPLYVTYAEHVSGVASFCEYLHRGYKYLLGSRGEKPPRLDQANIENLSKIVNPVAKDAGAQINIGTLNYAPVITINSVEANAVQNGARREIELLREPVTGIREKVLLYFFQTRNDARTPARKETGWRGVIESVWRHPIKVVFGNQDVKSRILSGKNNLFKEAYVVDVSVETVHGKPALYKILELHDQFEKPDTGSTDGATDLEFPHE